MRLPTTAPYATADLPSNGPPRSLTVTLALYLVNAADRRIGPLCAPSAASVRRCGSSPASRAWGLVALASNTAAPDGAARSNRCNKQACRRAVGTEPAPLDR